MKKMFVGPGDKLIIPVMSKSGKIKNKEIKAGFWYDTVTGKQLGKISYDEYMLAMSIKTIKQFMDKVF